MKRITIRAVCLLTAAIIVFISSCHSTYPAESEDQIIDFLEECGISVSGEASVKNVTIPQEFGDVYSEYNEMQKQQGFDLSSYKAREAQVYTYSIVSVNGERTEFTQAHIMVCDSRIIAADISSPALDGGMAPVK